MLDWKHPEEEQTQLFACADQLLEALTRLIQIHRKIVKLASQDDSPSTADLKWRDIHNLHKMNKDATKSINMSIPAFLLWHGRNPDHTVFPRLIARLNRIINTCPVVKVELEMKDLMSERTFQTPYEEISEDNNQAIKQLYRRLYAADIEGRKSQKMCIVRNVLKKFFAGNITNDLQEPIAKSNMIYVEAVDTLQKHIDVHQRESISSFDMTVSLTENISKLLDGMMSRNKLVLSTINKYAIDFNDHQVRRLRASREKPLEVQRISRVMFNKRNLSGRVRNSQRPLPVNEVSISLPDGIWQPETGRASKQIKDRKSIFGTMVARRFSPAYNNLIEPTSPIHSIHRDSSRLSLFNRTSFARSSSINNNCAPAPVHTLCDVIKENQSDLLEATRLETCLSVVGILDGGSTSSSLGNQRHPAKKITDKTSHRPSCHFSKLHRVRSTLYRFIEGDSSLTSSSHHFDFHRKRLSMAKKPSYDNQRLLHSYRSHSPKQLTSNQLFIAVKQRTNLHNILPIKTAISYDDFVTASEL